MSKEEEEQVEANKNAYKAAQDYVARLEEAEKLLEQIYHEVGPYSNGKIEGKTWDKVRGFYFFDDSE